MSNADVRVVVAMSGGVDSSVAAALLREQGYAVVGMMMRLWSDAAMGGAEHNRCCTPEQMADARRIADGLGIPFYVLDTKEVFRSTVVEYFLEGHRQGFTPNPCMECNRHIRFDWLLNHALALDADYLATGHYARIDRAEDGHYRLRQGLDEAKDQSYILSVMGQAQLAQTLFPVGEFPKPEVRALAARFGLNVASKKDSQDLCFLGQNDYRDFLKIHAPEILQPGPIVLKNGVVIGEHTGLSNYTIGQRKGLGVMYPEPLYVIAMNPYKNALVVGVKDELGRATLTAKRFNWVQGVAPAGPFRAGVKIRYKSPLYPALIEPLAADRIRVTFEEPLRDITPGQGAVVYAGDVVLGGGVIEKDDPA
ncbi:MAG: tRNA 2-thiouridine(34) synthase MnmA [Anaerolineae bacterium]|jgi:tRNA-specific 2-thiouridylase|nr:tRNA 2-thiouridine(34) synthase MnmA [Anaerolineae bacterium]